MDILRTLCVWLCQTIYRLIAWAYQLFINISRVEILTSDEIKPIYERITMILAIIMVFYVTFEFVKFIVQPEGFSDKEKGASKIILRMILVVIFIAFVPNVFSWAYKLQNAVIDNQVIPKVLLGTTKENMEEFGKDFSSDVLGIFYYIDESIHWQKDVSELDCGKGVKCQTIVDANLNTLRNNGEIPLLEMGIYEKEPVEDSTEEFYVITFEGLLAVVVGGFILYMLVLYCVDVGTRVVKLLFLQIMAPIPIIGYLSPKKDGIFEKWAKQCITTYLDLFIRIAIIYFVLLVCQVLGKPLSSTVAAGMSGKMDMFVFIALVLGLLAFAKKAPDMVKELLPKTNAASGNFGLSLKDRPGVAQLAGASLGMGLVGTRKLIGAGINRFKRNRLNKEQSEKDQQNFEEKDKIFTAAQKRRRDLQSALATARRTGNKTEAEKIEQKLKDEEQNYQDAKRERDSAKAKRDNTKHRSTLFSALAGGVTGAAQGAWAGFKATDGKSIVKQVQEGFKNADASLAKTEKWYNEGGGNYIDRGIASVEHALGVSSSTDRIAQEVRYVDEQIKNNDVLISAETDTKAKKDDVEKRLESKLESGELKTTVGSNGVKYLQGKIKGLDVNESDTLSSVYARARSATEAARSKLDAVIKNGGDEAAARRELEQAQETEKAVKKHTMRAAYTYMLQNPNDSANIDALAKDKSDTMEESINNARRNEDTVKAFEAATQKDFEDALKAAFGSDDAVQSNKGTAEYKAIENKYRDQIKAFKGEKSFADYDELDEVITRLQNIASARSRENMGYKETKRRIESSYATQAAKADNSSVGGK